MFSEWAKQIRLKHWILPRMHRTYGSLSLADAFRRVYQSKAWGGNDIPFCSGPGSDGTVSDRYCESVAAFVRDHHIQSIIDLGCGDFAIGHRIVRETGVHYTAVDVVPELIEHHRMRMQYPGTKFLCADITRDKLPHADLCLIRQVLQHLSNDEIARTLQNVDDYPFVLISEDVPLHPKSFNRDKPHGPDVRAFYGSGVYLDQPPFSQRCTELWTFPLRTDALLRTVLFQPE